MMARVSSYRWPRMKLIVPRVTLTRPDMTGSSAGP